jgi:hypothetical protein
VADERRAEEPRRRGFLKPDRAMAREEPAPGDRQPPPRRER